MIDVRREEAKNAPGRVGEPVYRSRAGTRLARIGEAFLTPAGVASVFHPRDIRKHMHVIAALGGYVGTVDRVEGRAIRLTDCPFSREGRAHVPLAWVEAADGAVRLDRSHEAISEELCPTGAGALEWLADTE
jgi:hypothetical protein